MRILHTIAAGLQSLLRRKKTDQELDEELGAFLELATEEKLKYGMSRKEALREVRLERGNLDVSKELVRAGGWENFVETCWQDLIYAARTLRKSPGFTFVALLTLALGIGATTAIFSVVYGVLLQPLPFNDAARLILLNETTPRVGVVSVSYPNFQDWRAQTIQFSQIAAVSSVGFNLAGINQPEAIRGEAVSPNFLSVLGVKPALGRDFDPSEEKAGAAPVLLLSYALWQSHFGADPSALGRTIMLDGKGYTIVGVLPGDFRWPEKVDVLEPMGVWAGQKPQEAAERGQRGDLVVLGRLAPAATFAQAHAEMEGIASRLAKEYPGAIGLFLAYTGIQGMTQMIGVDRLSGATVAIKGVVLLFAAGIVALATFVFGLVPALRSTKPFVLANLKEGSAGAGGGASQNRLRGIFVVAELALSLILLTGAGLMMKSLHLLLSVSPGFQPDRVLHMEMNLRSEQYDKDPAVQSFFKRVLDQVSALPGVQSVSLGTNLPMMDSHDRTDITIEGMPLPKPGSFPHPDLHVTSTGYFATMGIPLLSGRTFTEADNENAQRVGIINARLAKEFFPHGDAVGKRFTLGRPSETEAPKWIEIVGVVGDTKLYGLTNPARFEVYGPFPQWTPNEMDLLVKTSVDPAAMTSAIRGAIASIDKDQPIFAISTMNQLVSDSVSTRTFTLVLLGLL